LHDFISVLNISQADFSHFFRATSAPLLLDLNISRDFFTATLISCFVGKDRAFNRSVFLVVKACKMAVWKIVLDATMEVSLFSTAFFTHKIWLEVSVAHDKELPD
jgi:hypothetical protein